MGLIDRLNLLDERGGILDGDKKPISSRALWREVLRLPLLPWFLIAVGVGVVAGAVFAPLGFIVIPLAGVILLKAEGRARRADRDT